MTLTMRLAVFCSTILLLGCGGSTTSSAGSAPTTQAAIDDTCTTNCAAQKKCDSKVDETTCVNACKDEGAPFVGKVRADYVAFIGACSRAASCDQLRDCDNQAKASITASATTQSFCDAYVTKASECKLGADRSRCLDSFKIFADPTLSSARSCLEKPCSDWLGCVGSTVGVGVPK